MSNMGYWVTEGFCYVFGNLCGEQLLLIVIIVNKSDNSDCWGSPSEWMSRRDRKDKLLQTAWWKIAIATFGNNDRNIILCKLTGGWLTMDFYEQSNTSWMWLLYLIPLLPLSASWLQYNWTILLLKQPVFQINEWPLSPHKPTQVFWACFLLTHMLFENLFRRGKSLVSMQPLTLMRVQALVRESRHRGPLQDPPYTVDRTPSPAIPELYLQMVKMVHRNQPTGRVNI